MWTLSKWDFAAVPDEGGQKHHMDPIHVEMIYRFLMANKFRAVLEVGCKFGFSTSAMVQALRDGKKFSLLCCDIAITDSLKRVTEDSQAILVQSESVNLLPLLYGIDCLVLDGDHEWSTVERELNFALGIGISTIIGHDVSRCDQDGPARMLARLRDDYKWRCWVEDLERPEMSTERGLMIATASDRVEPAAKARSKPWGF